MPTPINYQPKMPKFDFSTEAIIALAKRRRYFSISIIAWIAIVLLAVTILAPSVQQILDARTKLATATAELQDKQKKITDLRSLDISAIAKDNAVLSAALPSEKPVLPVLYSIDRLASNSAVSVANFQVSPGLLGTSSAKLDTQQAAVSKISPKIVTLPLKMNVSGPFTNLSSFFQSLDGVIPFLQITSIQFSSDDESIATTSATTNYSAEVTLSSLYLKTAIAPDQLTQVRPLNSKELELMARLGEANDQRLADNANVMQTTISTNSGLLFIAK